MGLFFKDYTHDRVMAFCMLLKNQQDEMFRQLGIPKERMGELSNNINRIWDEKLLNDLLNYKPNKTTMKKYKHIPTGRIFTETIPIYGKRDLVYHDSCESISIPAWLANGNDWELVKNPVLTTEDGVQKFQGDDVWYVRPDNTIYHWKKIDVFHNPKGYHFFNTEAACKKHLDLHEKRFTKQQVLDAIGNSSMLTTHISGGNHYTKQVIDPFSLKHTLKIL